MKTRFQLTKTPSRGSFCFDMDAQPRVKKHSDLVALAAQAIETYVRSSRMIALPEPIPEIMRSPAAAFVSIKKHGRLRGCIGTIRPSAPSLAEEIIANAVKAATADPRFPAIVEEELNVLSVSVDVLTQPEPCEPHDLDPSVYGVIVESGWKRGLLLPDLEGVSSREDQLSIAKQKAGIGQDQEIRVYRFTVERHV